MIASAPTPAAAFSHFANETRGRSPIYAHLADAAVDDPFLCSMLAEAPPGQRRANLLFAAVHDPVLEQHDASPLADWYPSVGGTRAPDTHLTATFRAVVADNEPRIVEMLHTRATQTNEVGRAAVLWPAVQWLARALDGPVALIELGASAGLLLHMDRLEGISSSPDASPSTRLDIRRRVGVDLSPLDVTDEADTRWLRACIWPDNLERFQRLDAAISIAASHHDVEMVKGDIGHALPGILDRVAPHLTPVVFHSAAVTYLSEPARHLLYEHLDTAGKHRPLAWLSFEGARIDPLEHVTAGADRPAGSFTLAAATWAEGERTDQLLGFADPHGAWAQWEAAIPSAGRG